MLKQNGTILAQYPFRLTGGGIVAGSRAMWGRSELKNMYVSEGITDKKAAIPNGHLAPSAWLLPQEPGGMASHNEAVATLTAIATASQGINIIGSASMSITASGTGAAIAAAEGAAAMSMTASGTPTGVFNASGSASMSMSAAATPTGVATITGSASMSLSASLETGAIAHLQSQPISQELTVDQIVTGVWSAPAAANNNTGTMGEKLNDAGSAGNPWASLTASNNDPGTFGALIQDIPADVKTELQADLTKLDELHKIQGLDPLAPMTVTPTSRTADDIELAITGDGVTTSTVTRT